MKFDLKILIERNKLHIFPHTKILLRSVYTPKKMKTTKQIKLCIRNFVIYTLYSIIVKLRK